MKVQCDISIHIYIYIYNAYNPIITVVIISISIISFCLDILNSFLQTFKVSFVTSHCPLSWIIQYLLYGLPKFYLFFCSILQMYNPSIVPILSHHFHVQDSQMISHFYFCYSFKSQFYFIYSKTDPFNMFSSAFPFYFFISAFIHVCKLYEIRFPCDYF